MLRFYSLLLVIVFAACSSKNELKEVKIISHYPSASGIDYLNKQVYIIGDDASNLMILDSNLIPKDSLSLYSNTEKRIPKAVKPDLESITITNDNQLLLLGSGSSAPYRNIAWFINPLTKQKDSIRLDTFYQRLKANGIQELNIEGSCAMPGHIILSNRGSKGYPKNHLIFTHREFWKQQITSRINTILIGSNTDSTTFSGVSGMTYASKTDELILTVSTEDTRNNMDDGAIGKSYLWIVKNISAKTKWKAINPDRIIDLNKLDNRFSRQKIESVCILKETKKLLHLLLAADNDNGSSTLFQVIVSKD
jgi:hypothetical protein